MKASKKLQKQFADFKAEFVHLCKAFGGERNERGEHTGGENSAFIIPAPWGKIKVSIGLPWSICTGEVYDGWRKYSSAEIYLCAEDYKELPSYWCDVFDSRPHWKWNIHRVMHAGGMYVECCNAALTEFSRRLEKATGKTEAQAMRGMDIANGELWQVYEGSDTPVLFECSSRGKALKWLKEKFGMASYRNGAVRIGQLIWEESGVTV